jgi:crotonobetainyl-CoA:carnitine CoA-transferase CaiB-like acyl-CoA transferase
MTQIPTSGGPLAGIRVIELARVLAGPWAGQILADMGADVIKIEHPDGGDDTRQWGPPFVTAQDGTNLSAAYFHGTNRGKRSITVDLRTEEGQEVIRRLVATADVLIENFKFEGLDKYGLDYASLEKINPKLVYCSITGFGHTGPYAHFAGYDFIVQGMSGFMSITGERGGEPMKAGVAIADVFTGVYAVTAIQAALIHAMKTGQGQHIDMALMDTQIGILANQNLNFLVSGTSPSRIGNANPNIMPYEVFPVEDGHLILAVGNDGQFAKLCQILETDWPQEERFRHNQDRVANRVELRRLICEKTSGWKKLELLHACEGSGVPVGNINSIGEMFDDPQVKARGMQMALQDRDGNVIPSVRNPVVLSRTPLIYERPSPRLGEHTDEILAEIAQQDNA